MRHWMWLRQSQARHRFDVSWVAPCSTMAALKGIISSRIPIRIIPPAVPKIPDRNEVERMAPASAVANGSVSMGASERERRLNARLTVRSQTRLTQGQAKEKLG